MRSTAGVRTDPLGSYSAPRPPSRYEGEGMEERERNGLVHLSDCIFYLLRSFNFCLVIFFIYVVLPHSMVK